MADKKSENAKAAAKKTAKKPNVFNRRAKYLGSCKSEIKKITWPTAKQTTKNFGIVIASPPVLNTLSSPVTITRRTILQKVRHHTLTCSDCL